MNNGPRHSPEVREDDRAESQDDLRRIELVAILGKKSQNERSSSERQLWGLALSGGGIRSATFCLGVLQALAHKGWLSGFHYVSSVSGGGFINAYLQGLIHRWGLRRTLKELDPAHAYDSAKDESPSNALENHHKQSRRGDRKVRADGETVRDLRRYSNYLTPSKAGLSADRITMVSTYLSNMLLTQVQLASWLVLLMFAPMLLYYGAIWLATDPWFSLSLAATCVLVAMGMRGLVQYRFEHEPRHNAPVKFAASAKVLPPILLTAAVVSLALLLWGPDSCGLESADSLCRRWESLSAFAEKRYVNRGLASVLSPETARPARNAFQALAVSGVYATGFVAWLVWWCAREIGSRDFGSRLLRQVVVGLVVTFLIALAVLQVVEHDPPWFLVSLPWGFRDQTPHLWWTLIFGAPAVMLLFYLASLAQVGLTFASARDRVGRERWARLMGRTALYVTLGVSLPVALVSVGPWAMRQVAGLFSSGVPNHSIDWVLPLFSFATSAFGARMAYLDQTANLRSQPRWRVTVRRVLISIAPIALIAGILMLNALVADSLLPDQGESTRQAWRDLPNWLLLPPQYPADSTLDAYLLRLHHRLFEAPGAQLFSILAIIAAIGFVFSKYIDENEFSMNGFYRNRLVRCYLAPSRNSRRGDPEMDLDPTGDDVKLGALLRTSREHDPVREFRLDDKEYRQAHRPLYPLISATANLASTRDLDWQDRRAASFVFSPLFCGHVPLPGRGSKPIGDLPPRNIWHADLQPSNLNPSPLAEKISLGTAVSISGAAVSPQMGYRSTPAIAFLLTLFNARLGWWIENRNVTRGFLGRVGSKLLSELLGRSDDSARYAYVSDGGHFENLGIYELVRRRCRFIVSVDATADPDRDFECLGNAVHKCRVDLGARIDIDVSLMRPDSSGVSRRSAALGKIHYDGDERLTGLILYIKPSLIGNETADIANYVSGHREFPHEPTQDQAFDEQQFEAYRELGYSIGKRLLTFTTDRRRDRRLVREPLAPSASHPLRVEDDRKETLLLELEHWLFEPSNATSLRFSQHGAALARLFENQRQWDALAPLDDQLYPGWKLAASGKDLSQKGAPSGPRRVPRIPEGDAFRQCFYFVQEVIQLMESVYIDLDLERNHEHPDNRGWLNLFRQWGWVPMFRLVWSMTSHTLGSRFVRFCESRLSVPQLTEALVVVWRRAPDVAKLADDLHKSGEISYAERALLQSKPLTDACENYARMDVGLVRVNWEAILGTAAADRPKLVELNVGLVVAVSSELRNPQSPPVEAPLEVMIVARVQDHLRRMGFGAEMVYRAVRTDPDYQGIRKASIAAGDYGEAVGRITPEQAKKQQIVLQEMLERAHQREPVVNGQASIDAN